MKRHKGNKKAQLITIIVFAIIVIFSAFFGEDILENNIGTPSGNIQISYLDVGQGDAAYIRVNDFDILIDAGPSSDSDKLMEQLEDKNIDDFEIVIATHPHEDHIGGMTKVFEKYEVKSFYMPKVTHTTKTFENMMKAVSNEGLKAKVIKEGTSIDLGEGAKFETYSPIEDTYDNLNNYSPIMKLTYGNKTFLFTGDAEKEVETEVAKKYSDELNADVIKFGHHGSSTSSSADFIEAISPQYGIISCGVDNSYGHPHRETLDVINKLGIETYRTDKQGQITVTSDGNTINITTQK
ncbi:ComEC/Rec2 family competence protein [Clostridium sp. AL.422]|uniref:ComEC/Rec2 family competence protein n=1 Tax=Clostridium TaxID=1485 RepID=UPI00293DA8C2|nr:MULTISPECIES: ComEC/Rec2 family competence protein [unclassified Clostridium]MDV4149644.1 ComEC/Rec2 family competence protein [Clostridium sp. AL.422]